MKNLKFLNKTWIVLVLVLVGFSSAFAQDYKTAIGARISKVNDANSYGLTINQNLTPRFFVEGIFERTDSKFDSIDAKQSILAGLLKYHKPLLSKKLNAYIGFGGNINVGDVDFQDFKYGLVGMIGVEIQVPLFPIIASLDYKPSLNSTEEAFAFDDASFGLSARWIWASDDIKKRKLKKEKKKNKQEKKELKVDQLKAVSN